MLVPKQNILVFESDASIYENIKRDFESREHVYIHQNQGEVNQAILHMANLALMIINLDLEGHDEFDIVSLALEVANEREVQVYAYGNREIEKTKNIFKVSPECDINSIHEEGRRVLDEFMLRTKRRVLSQMKIKLTEMHFENLDLGQLHLRAKKCLEESCLEIDNHEVEVIDEGLHRLNHGLESVYVVLNNIIESPGTLNETKNQIRDVLLGIQNDEDESPSPDAEE